jgi:hypothetical protein
MKRDMKIRQLARRRNPRNQDVDLSGRDQHAKPWSTASAKAVIAIRIADTPGGLAADRRRVGIAI